jgi:hypothetical protein
VVAVRERYAGVGGDAEWRCDTGHDFERHAGLSERFSFFTAAAEHERIAALETHHVEAACAAIDEQRADFLLRESVRGFFLANVEAFGGGGREIEQIGAREMIVENGIGLGEKAFGFHGDEFGIAWSCAYQVDLAHREPEVSTSSSNA